MHNTDRASRQGLRKILGIYIEYIKKKYICFYYTDRLSCQEFKISGQNRVETYDMYLYMNFYVHIV